MEGKAAGVRPAEAGLSKKQFYQRTTPPANGRGRGLLCTYLLRSSNTCTSSRANRREHLFLYRRGQPEVFYPVRMAQPAAIAAYHQ